MAGHYGSHPTLMFAAGQSIVKGLYSTPRDPKDIFNAQLIEVGNQKVSHFWLCLSLLDPIQICINSAHNRQLFLYILISYSENLIKISISIN